jgi:hypothetical protein
VAQIGKYPWESQPVNTNELTFPFLKPINLGFLDKKIVGTKIATNKL